MNSEFFCISKYNDYLKLQETHNKIFNHSRLWYSISSISNINNFITDINLSIKYIKNIKNLEDTKYKELEYKNNKYILSSNIIPKVSNNKSNQYILFKQIFNPYFKKYKLYNKKYKIF